MQGGGGGQGNCDHARMLFAASVKDGVQYRRLPVPVAMAVLCFGDELTS